MKRIIGQETVWALVEAALFESNQSMSLEQLGELFGGAFSMEELESLLEKMEWQRWQDDRGVVLINRNGKYALEARLPKRLRVENITEREATTNLDDWGDSEKTILAIIAYEGPVKLERIEAIMGAECSHYVLFLHDRGLVKKRGAMIDVTPTFYGLFGLKDRDELLGMNGLKMEINHGEEKEDLFEESAFLAINDPTTSHPNPVFDPVWFGL